MSRLHSGADAWLNQSLFLLALLVASVLLLIIAFILKETFPVIEGVGLQRFVTDEGWTPLENQFGMMPMLWGTLAATALSILIAAPVGVATAVYCRFMAHRHAAKLMRGMLVLLAGTPSVVFGFWGLTVLVPLIVQIEPPGASLLAASLVLALMIVPTIALMVDAMIAALPDEYLRGAHALGMSRAAMVLYVILPAAKRGIVAAIILATARALGETMAVLMVSGNVVNTPSNIFEPIRVLTANIALEMAYATTFHRATLFVSGLVLMMVVALLVWLAHRVAQVQPTSR